MAPVYPVQDPWGYWTGATSITASATVNNTVWLDWNQTTATTSTSIQIWNEWNAYYANHSRPSLYTPPPAEEIERRKKLAEEQNKKLKLAKERARKILVENLSDEQKAELKKEGHFHIETRDGQRRYRLRPGRPPIRVRGEDGRRLSFCIHPRSNFPADDVTLALKLMIETDEDRFLSVANATPIGA